jgi:hypothetical protein
MHCKYLKRSHIFVGFQQSTFFRCVIGQNYPSIDDIYGDMYAFKMCIHQNGCVVSNKGIKEFAKACGKLDLLEKQHEALKLVFVVPQNVSLSYVIIDFPQSAVFENSWDWICEVGRLMELQPPVTTIVEFIHSYSLGRKEFYEIKFDPEVHEYIREVQKQEKYVDADDDQRDYSFMKRTPQYVLVIDPIHFETRACSYCRKKFVFNLLSDQSHKKTSYDHWQ